VSKYNSYLVASRRGRNFYVQHTTFGEKSLLSVPDRSMYQW